jgi:hypothetical protein
MPHTLFFRNHNYGHPHLPNGLLFPQGVAFLSDNLIWYSGVNFGGSTAPAPLANPDWSSLRKWVAETFGDSDPIESEYKPGTAYKRICWPFATSGNLHKTIDTGARTQSFVALKLLLTKMLDIFESVEPADNNLQVYGHKVRELLLLAAMEVEASWAAVLNANGYGPNPRLNTTDYVKLLAPMLLDSYRLELTSYPSFPPFAPFECWRAVAPTQSLDWYHAYNLTKHNREEHLNAATLEKAVHAVGAVVVMFYAQFGFYFTTGEERIPFIRSIFKMNFDGDRHSTSYYIPNVSNTVGAAGAASWDWELLDYPFSS